jgi:hypothetical protein
MPIGPLPPRDVTRRTRARRFLGCGVSPPKPPNANGEPSAAIASPARDRASDSDVAGKGNAALLHSERTISQTKP